MGRLAVSSTGSVVGGGRSSTAHTLFAAMKVLEFRSKVGGVLDAVPLGTFTP